MASRHVMNVKHIQKSTNRVTVRRQKLRSHFISTFIVECVATPNETQDQRLRMLSEFAASPGYAGRTARTKCDRRAATIIPARPRPSITTVEPVSGTP